MIQELKFSIVQQITAAGILTTANIADETKVRFVISSAGGGNTIVVRARIVGQNDWDTLATIVGNDKSVVNVSTYDEIQVECTVYSSLSNNVKVVASSFNDAGGSTSIDAPTGGTVTSDTIVFTSSDDSVVITAYPETGTIDFVAVGGGGGAAKYVKTVVLADWIGPSDGAYTLSIPFSFHSKANPVVTCLEENGVNFDVIDTSILLNGNDVTVLVLSTPDTRFVGKIFID